MGNNLGQPIISFKNQKLEEQSLHVTYELEKVGPLKFAASMALKIFKVPVVLVVFYDSKGVVLLNEIEDESRAFRLNSLAMVKGEFSYENEGEEIFL